MPICAPLNTEACKQSLYNQLAGASGPCAADLTDIVESAWDTAYIEACYDAKLLFYTAKRNVILALMGCEAYSVDESFRSSQADTVAKSTSASNLRSQQQATGSTNRFARSHGESRFNENSHATTAGDMARHARATETGDGLTTYRDDSHGDGFNNSDSLRTVTGDGESNTTRLITQRNTEAGSKVDCNFESSYNVTNTVNGVVGFPPLVIVAGDVTSSRNEWRKFINRSESHTRSHFRLEVTTGDAFRETNGVGSSTHTWQSNFYSDIEQHHLDTDIRVSKDRTDNRRHAEAQAKGDGNGLSEAKVESNSSAQGTSLSEATTTGLATSNSTSNSTGYTLANSQRFRNLRLMYDQLQQRIIHIKKHLRGSPRIGQLECPTLCFQTHRYERYSQLVAAGMQCCESTFSRL